MEYERVTLAYLDDDRFRLLVAKCEEILKAIEAGVGEIEDGTVGCYITDCIYAMLGEAYTAGKADRSPRVDLYDPEAVRELAKAANEARFFLAGDASLRCEYSKHIESLRDTITHLVNTMRE